MPVDEKQYEELRADVAELKRIIAGDPRDPRAESVYSRLSNIETALWGPPDHPNGIWGMVREGRVLGRTLVVGFFVSVGGAIVLKVLGG